MNSITTNLNNNRNISVLNEAEKKFNIELCKEIKDFIFDNAGGYPVKNVITVDGEEYEVRVFLSLDNNDTHYFIKEPLNDFLQKTKGRIVPLAIDSEDNYYCINNETGKLYYWSSELDEYFLLVDNLDLFSDLFV